LALSKFRRPGKDRFEPVLTGLSSLEYKLALGKIFLFKTQIIISTECLNFQLKNKVISLLSENARQQINNAKYC